MLISNKKLFTLLLVIFSINGQTTFYSYRLEKVHGVFINNLIDTIVLNKDSFDSTIKKDTINFNDHIAKTKKKTFISRIKNTHYNDFDNIFFEVSLNKVNEKKDIYEKRKNNSKIYYLKKKSELSEMIFYINKNNINLGYLSPYKASSFPFVKNNDSLAIMINNEYVSLFKKTSKREKIKTILGLSVNYRKYDYVTFFGEKFCDVYEYFTTHFISGSYTHFLVWFDKDFNLIRSENSYGAGVVKLSKRNRYVLAMEE